MPLTVLASVSLLALVVTGRPLLPRDSPQLVQPSGEVQDAVQAILESRLGSGYLKSDGDDEDEFNIEGGVQVRLTSSESQSAYLSQLASDDVKLIIPLGDNPLAPSIDEKTLYDALEGLNELDGGTRPLEEVLSDYDGEETLEDEEEYPSIVSPTQYAQPLVLTLVFCAVSLIVVLCVGVTLYALEFTRSNAFSKRFVWDLLPRIEKDVGITGGGRGNVDFKEKPMVLGVDVAEEMMDEKVQDILAVAHSESRETSSEDAMSSTGDDDDAFEDAPEGSDHPDPDLLPLPHSVSSPSRSPVRRPLQMREIPPDSPSWSIRASESPSLSLAPLAVEHAELPARRRAYRDPIPEIDIALALQMRPGFGVGADAAWLVRFMMGIFGWFSVLVSGGIREEARRLIRG